MTDKCEHRTCHCPARMDIEYCSQYCETAGDDFETGCRCGHAECQSTHTWASTAYFDYENIIHIAGVSLRNLT